MDLEAVFAMAAEDDMPRSVADPLHFHPSAKRTGSLSLFDDNNMAPSAAAATRNFDSDDDFGDFTSVPADSSNVAEGHKGLLPVTSADVSIVHDGALDTSHLYSAPQNIHAQTSADPDDLFGHFSTTVESTPNKVGSEIATSPMMKPLDNNSDDDWGDFVEHSTQPAWDNCSQAFDWFDTTQPNIEEKVSAGIANSTANGATMEMEAWGTAIPTEVQRLEEKAAGLTFDDLFGKRNLPSAEPQNSSACISNFGDSAVLSGQNLIATKRASLLVTTASPIPLSLFGEDEQGIENLKVELADPFTRPIRRHSWTNGAFPTGGKNLSDLLATLYTESEPTAMHNLDVFNIEGTDVKHAKDNLDKMHSTGSLYEIEVANGSSLEERMFNLALSPTNSSELVIQKVAHDAVVGGHQASNQNQSIMVIEATQENMDNRAVRVDSIVSMPTPLGSGSTTTSRCTYVRAWASVLAVCASELELASNVWKQAQCADGDGELLADSEGKRYFAAIGQVYAVALIMAATANLYKPWLNVVPQEEAESLRGSLERCKDAWLRTNLKEAVCLALGGLEGSVPTCIMPFKDVEGFATVVHGVFLSAAAAVASVGSLSGPICKLSLLPTAPFMDVPLAVEWAGSHYLLPLANLWANCISQEPPALQFVSP